MAQLANYIRPAAPVDPSTVPSAAATSQVAQFANQQLGGLTSGNATAAPGITPVGDPSVTAAVAAPSTASQQATLTMQHLRDNESNAQSKALSMYAARAAQKAAEAQASAGGGGGSGSGGVNAAGQPLAGGVGYAVRAAGNPGGEFSQDSALDNSDFLAGRGPAGLVRIGGGFLQQKAAQQLTVLNAAYHAATGGSLSLTEGWRSMSTQQRLYALYRAGRGVAVASGGNSIHSSGTAADLGGISSQGFRWLTANAPKYGWSWAGAGISGRTEPWLWKFVG